MTSINIVAMVVARTGSTRVPGKALLSLSGHPVLWHVIRIAKKIRGVSDICLTTTDLLGDDPIAELAVEAKVKCYRGNAENVLDRLHGAADFMKADAIVYIGGDCPLLDPEVISNAIDNYLMFPCDYLNNYNPPTFPEGFDINIVARSALDIAWKNAVAPSQRIHPFTYLTMHPHEFKIRNYEMSPDLSSHHWSLDFQEDIELIRMAYASIYDKGVEMTLENILNLISRDSAFANIDTALATKNVAHAFWNSPGMVRDMHNDIVALTQIAHEAHLNSDIPRAQLCYSEIKHIVKLLGESI